jgi:hypothetical protein
MPFPPRRKLWVTDKPNGDGATLLTMRFTATESDLRPQEKKPAAAYVRELMAMAADKRS